MQKIINFIFNRFIGLLFVVFFCFSLVSLVSLSNYDPYYGNFSSNEKINNFLGYSGSYFAGSIFAFIGLSSYLIPFYFLIYGLKKIIGIKTGLFFLRSLIFFFSIFLLCFLLNYWSLTSGVIGNFSFEIINTNFEYLFNKKYISFFVMFCIHIFSFLLLLYSLSLDVRGTKKVLYPILIIFKSILKILKLVYFLKPLLGFLSSKKIFKPENIDLKKSFNYKNKKRKEPTIEKNINIEKAKLNTKLDNNYTSQYIMPHLSLLEASTVKNNYPKEMEKQNEKSAINLENILKEYGVLGKISNYRTGPIVTLFEFQPSAGVKTSKVVGLATDIARSMSSMSARISSQPGKNSIGIEIPNEKRQDVYLGDLINDDQFKQSKKGLILALGKNISGEKVYTDLERMPHLLIAGTTGSGKSVGINSMIVSLLFRYKPSECKFIMIDPKMLELSTYENIPHLLTPVVTDPKKAVFALKWVVREMENRYRIMNTAGVKNIQSFNIKISSYLSTGKKLFREVQTGIDKSTRLPIIEKQEMPLEQLPLIVVIIDEMADLMMVAGKEVEHSIQRLAQMARAAGIHIIAATQRPSVDVITGTIKANFPSRISYRVASKFDSRTILNEMGAEQLLGSGDMLFLENGANLLRLHGGFISEKEINKVVNFINSQSTNEIQKDITNESNTNLNELNFDEDVGNIDELYNQAVSVIIQNQKASTSFLQRHLQIGYNRAARIIEQMEKEGIISEASHTGKRNVLKKNI